MKQLKNWDNKTWLSSKKYIAKFNKFISAKKKLNQKSEILDIGCGRGKILGSLKSSIILDSSISNCFFINHHTIIHVYPMEGVALPMIFLFP